MTCARWQSQGADPQKTSACEALKTPVGEWTDASRMRIHARCVNTSESLHVWAHLRYRQHEGPNEIHKWRTEEVEVCLRAQTNRQARHTCVKGERERERVCVAVGRASVAARRISHAPNISRPFFLAWGVLRGHPCVFEGFSEWGLRRQPDYAAASRCHCDRSVWCWCPVNCTVSAKTR